jgi:tape measure domain-containing protein
MANNNLEIIIKVISDQAKNSIDRLKASMSQLSTAASRKVNVALDSVYDGARRMAIRVDNARESMESFGQVGRRLSLVLVPLSLAFGFIGKKALEAAGEYEQLKIAFTTMLGSAELAEDMLSRLQRLALNTPFEFKELATLSTRLMAVGIAAGDLEPILMSLGNIAAGVGRERLPFLIKALGDVRAKGRLMGEEIRQFTNASVPILELLAQAMGKSIPEVQKLVREGQVGFSQVRAALELATAEGAKFFNLMENQSKTFLGSISNLKDALNFLGIEFGKHLLPAAKAVVNTVRAGVTWFLGLSESTKKAIVYVSLAVAAFTTLGAAISVVLAILPLVVGALAALKISASAAFIGLPVLIGLVTTALGLVIGNMRLLTTLWDVWGNKAAQWLLEIKLGFDLLINKFLNFYNIVAKSVPGLPVINLGFKSEKERIDAFNKSVEETKTKIEALKAANDALKDSYNKKDEPSVTPQLPLTGEVDTDKEGVKKEYDPTAEFREAEKLRLVQERIAAEKALLATFSEHQLQNEVNRLEQEAMYNAQKLALLDQFYAEQKIKHAGNQAELLALDEMYLSQQNELRAAQLEAENQTLAGREEIKNRALDKDMEDQRIADENYRRGLQREKFAFGKNISDKLGMGKQQVAAFGVMQEMMAKAGLENSKEMAAVNKGFALYQIGIDSYQAAMSAYKALAPIPYVGPALGVVAAGAALAFGAQQAANVTSKKPQLAEGGLVRAKNGGRDVTVAEAGMDEAVIPLDDPVTARRIQNAVGGGDTTIVLNIDGVTFAQAVVKGYNKGRDMNAVTKLVTR